jgi:hypothetical protein
MLRLSRFAAALTLPMLTATAFAMTEGPTTAPATVAVIAEAPPEAYVTDVTWIESSETGAKIYSTAGGDPAINGLYTFIAIASDEPGGGWRVFQIGDFNSWKIGEQTKDHIILAVSRSWVDQASGDIKTVEEKLKVPLVAPSATEMVVTPVK